MLICAIPGNSDITWCVAFILLWKDRFKLVNRVKRRFALTGTNVMLHELKTWSCRERIVWMKTRNRWLVCPQSMWHSCKVREAFHNWWSGIICMWNIWAHCRRGATGSVACTIVEVVRPGAVCDTSPSPCRGHTITRLIYRSFVTGVCWDNCATMC